MDILMTTYTPPCVNPFMTEKVRVVEISKNIGIVEPFDLDFRTVSRTMVIDQSSEGRRSRFDRSSFINTKLKPNISKFKEVLESFKDLSDNWDTYGAIAPNSDVINKSQQILNILNELTGKVNIVYPLNEGVQIDYNTENFKYEIEIFSDDIKLVKFDSEEEYLNQYDFDNTSMYGLRESLV